MAPGFRIIDFVSQLTFATTISITQRVPAGLTCLNEVAAGLPRAALSSRTSCHPFRASRRLMKPGDPFTTGRKYNYKCITCNNSSSTFKSIIPNILNKALSIFTLSKIALKYLWKKNFFNLQSQREILPYKISNSWEKFKAILSYVKL